MWRLEFGLAGRLSQANRGGLSVVVDFVKLAAKPGMHRWLLANK